MSVSRGLGFNGHPPAGNDTSATHSSKPTQKIRRLLGDDVRRLQGEPMLAFFTKMLRDSNQQASQRLFVRSFKGRKETRSLLGLIVIRLRSTRTRTHITRATTHTERESTTL